MSTVVNSVISYYGFRLPAGFSVDKATPSASVSPAPGRRIKWGDCKKSGRFVSTLLAVLLSAFPAAGSADEVLYDLDIPPSDAAEALNAFAEQTGAITLFPFDVASSRQANEVVGRYSLAEGLELLLRGSGLTGGLSDKQVIQISAAAEKKSELEEGEMNPRKRAGAFKRMTAGLATMFLAAPVLGQDTADDSDGTIEEIVVKGYRQSLATALSAKRDSDSIAEFLSAEDIGRLPDVSITESLARLPGLSASRVMGTATEINIRGMDGRLGTSFLNGHEQATPSSSRVVDYSQYPSEIITGAKVFKSPIASLPAGGISGTIDLQTIKPLSLEKDFVAMNVRQSVYGMADDIPDAKTDGYRATIAYAGKFQEGRLGLAFGYAGLDWWNGGVQASNWAYTDSWRDLDGDGQGNDAIPWGMSFGTQAEHQKRHGGVAVLQWKPTELTSVDVDFYASRFDTKRMIRGVRASGASTWENSITDAVVVNGAVLTGTVSRTCGWCYTTVPVSELTPQLDRLYAAGIKVTHEFPRLTVAGDASWSQSDRDSMWFSARSNAYIGQWRDWTQNYTFNVLDRDVVAVSFSNDLLDHEQMKLDTLEVVNYLNDDELYTAQLDFSYELDSETLRTIQWGVRYYDREKDRLSESFWEDFVDSAAIVLSDAETFDVRLPGSDYAHLPAFFSFDAAQAAANYFSPIVLGAGGRGGVKDWNITEDISAAYLMTTFQGHVGSVPFSGNLGLRFEETKTESLSVAEADGSPVDETYLVPNSYQETLPSLNIAFDLTDKQLLRFGLSKTIARPPLDSLNAGVSRWGVNEWGGNPLLEPFRANQFDVSYENYFKKGSAWILAGYYKDLDTFIVDLANPNDLGGTFYQPGNGKGGHVAGIETALTIPFDFAPDPLKGLGAYLVYSYVDSEVALDDLYSDLVFSLPGMSDHVAKAVLWYDRGGFSIRASYSYRSEAVSNGPDTRAELTFMESNEYVDLQATYRFSEASRLKGLQLILQGNNLLDTPYRTYHQYKERVGSYQTYGRRYLAGFSLTF